MTNTAPAIDRILDEALRVSRSHGNARIVRLDIELSPAGQIGADDVRRGLRAHSRGTPAQDAEIAIVRSEHHFRCSSCGQGFTSPEAAAATECPMCEEPAMSLEPAGDCVLTAVEVANPASGSD